MYNNRKNDTLVAEKVTTTSIDELLTFDSIDLQETKTGVKAYQTPTIEYIEQEVDNVVQEYNEDFMPSSTTLQFCKENSEIRQEVEKNQKTKKVTSEKDYTFNTKAKILVAVYSLVLVTILSLILINSRLLKNLDSIIGNYSSQVTELNQEYNLVMEELEEAKSDEAIIEKALEMGMEKA